MNNLNDLTLEQKATIVKKARFRDKQQMSIKNVDLVAFLFDLERAQSIKLCHELEIFDGGTRGKGSNI